MILHYPCPNCGAEMTYDIKKGKLHCGHCSGEIALSSIIQQSTSWTAEGGTSTEIDGKILAGAEYHCPNCGGLMITKDKETSTMCAYCGAPMILTDRLTGKRRPAKLLPFQLDRHRSRTPA